jgi:hypothetical protein
MQDQVTEDLELPRRIIEHTATDHVRQLAGQIFDVVGHGSGSSSGRAWARSRISSTITSAMVMALRHDRARSGCQQLERWSAPRRDRSSASTQFPEIHRDRQ